MDYSGKALLSLLNGVLDYSRLEAKRMELEHCSFDPRLLVESLVVLMSARASEKGFDSLNPYRQRLATPGVWRPQPPAPGAAET